MTKTLIHRAEIINEGERFTGSVLITDDKIEKIFINPDDAEIGPDWVKVDASGMLLLPGVIDDHVHFREPGLTHKAEIFSESRAAAAGGITSFMEMPNTIPPTTTIKALHEKQSIASKTSVTNYSFYFGATNDNIEEIKAVDPHTVCGIKVFMGSSTGNMQINNDENLNSIFKESPVLVACHCEDENIIIENLKTYIGEYGEDLPFEYHPLIRSREACLKSSSKAVALARKHGTRLHILHLSTRDEMDLFRNDIPLSDKKITAEVCVHHLWYNDSFYKSKGALIKWNPAIKKEDDRRALIDSINNNKIDIVATDHAPHTKEEKSRNYSKAPSGGPLVQHSLTIMLELWKKGEVTIEKVVEKMCHNPAILFNIENRGFIREGYKADLVMVDPNYSWEVNEDNILYKCQWSPFTGEEFGTKVVKTYINGNLVWDNGTINDSHPGELLIFNR